MQKHAASLLCFCVVQPEDDGHILTYPVSATLSDANFMSGSLPHGSTQRHGPPSFSSVVHGSAQPDIDSEFSLS